jgi:hypothetical protein
VWCRRCGQGGELVNKLHRRIEELKEEPLHPEWSRSMSRCVTVTCHSLG